MDENAWTIITDNPVIFDFTECDDRDVHSVIRKAFGFPAYYGENWNAFWDCIQDFFISYGSWGVEIRGYDSLSEEFRQYLQPMFDMFKEVEQTYPDIVVSVTISS